jgi:DNA-binding transcriptional ArsR family regulator
METMSEERTKGRPGRRMGSGKRAGSDAAWGLRALQGLADPSRWRIVTELAAAPRTMGELAERIDLSAACTTHHISILKEMEFVVSTREARQVRCSLATGNSRAARLLAIVLGERTLPKVSNRTSSHAAPELETAPTYSKPIEEFLF